MIEKKAYLEKIAFLRSIPIFSKLTKTSLGKMTFCFQPKTFIKGQVLYKEGEPAESVFIIMSGEIQMSKKILREKEEEENVEAIMKNPLKANKHKNKLFVGKRRWMEENVKLFLVSRGNTVGEDDVVPFPPHLKIV